MPTPPPEPQSSHPAVTVWPTAQATPAQQRKHHYTRDSTAHPAKMLPDIAAHAITHYTNPGELVLDPMCGIGTTLVEAQRLGRHALGIDYETRWARLAQTNLDLATEASTTGRVLRGDARQLPHLLPAQEHGQAALVVTSPPYGPSVHGQIANTPKIRKYNHRYGSHLDRGNLANIGHHRLLAGFTRILAGCTRALRPGGHVVITVRPWREHSSTCPPKSPPAADKPDSSPSNAASPYSAASPTTTTSPAAASSNATSSANNARRDYPCTSSPTKTSSSSKTPNQRRPPLAPIPPGTTA